MVPFRYEDLKSRDLNKNYNNKPFITCVVELKKDW